MTDVVIPHSRPWIEVADELAVKSVVHDGMIAHGDCVVEFEQAVASLFGISGGIACTSGTAALILALKTLGVGVGDEVLLPTYVCWNVLAAITAVGASPRLCDVDDNGVLTTQTVQAARTSDSKAIVAVHIFGHPCDIASLNQLGLPVIEDACQSFGLEISGNAAGTLGAFGVFSFHATKCLTTGEGGMLIASSPTFLERARILTKSLDFGNAANLAAMSDLQARLGQSQLARYPDFLSRRRQIFDLYHQCATRLYSARPGYYGTPRFLFRYTLRTQRGFDSIQSDLLDKGLQVRRGVDVLLHRRLGLGDDNFPIAVKLYEQNISIPFYPSLSDYEVGQILRALQGVFGGA